MKCFGLTGKIAFMFFLYNFTAFAPNRISPAAGQQISAPEWGKGGEEEGLTLPQAVEVALKNNSHIKATLSGREMADAQVREARGGRWPLLQFSETFTWSNNPVFVFGSLLEQSRFGPQNFDIGTLNNPEPLNNFRTAVNLKWPLFDQMQSHTRIAQARFEGIRAYYGVLVAKEGKEVADEAVKMAESDQKRTGDLFQSGLVVQSDLLSAEVQVAEFRQHQIQAAGELVTAYAFLNTVMGLPVQTLSKISGKLAERQFSVAETDELLRLALQPRPDYSKAGSAIRIAEGGFGEPREIICPGLICSPPTGSAEGT